MRLSSFLPMLLLLVSPIAAQQNCQIFDLTAQVVQFDPNTCTYFVQLNFQHAGTSNQFTVHGNGVNYGLFEYGQLPVSLGPFMSAPNNLITHLEFQVQDAVFLDCTDAVTVDGPACALQNDCDIFDLTVSTGNCDLSSNTYEIEVDFQVLNTSNDSFNLWSANGTLMGTYALNALPINISNFPWGGGVFDHVKVCILGNADCCGTKEFIAPTCFNTGCNTIVDLNVATGDCLSDSTYKAVVNFGLLLGTPPADSFDLYLDGNLHGTYALNQLPLPVVFETNSSTHSVVKICIEPLAGLVCCLEKEFLLPSCISPCGINDLTVTVDSCTSDSTFGIWVNFQVNDSTAVDSFTLSGNGHVLGHFSMNQLPLNLPNFEWNGLIFNHIRVCTGNLPTCCKEISFLAPDCLPFGPCEIVHLNAAVGGCTSDSTFKLGVNFNATNPGNGTFSFTNLITGQIDTFNLTDLPLMFPNFPITGAAGAISVCILDSSSNVPATLCCKTIEFQLPNCNPDCHIFDLNVQVGDCNPDGSYHVTINFGFSNPGNDLFDVFANGQLIGTYQLSQLPLHIPNFPGSGNAVDVIKVCINDHPDCCVVKEFQAPNCDGDCHIFDLNVQVGDCNPDSTYHVTINFGFSNPGNDLFDVFANGQLIGTYQLSQLPLHIPNFPGSGNAVDVIKVCINDHPDCCVVKEFQAPNCDGDCHIFDLNVQVGDCNPDSTYHVTINFGFSNPGNDLFDVFANGQLIGTYQLSQLPLHIPNFPGSGNAVDVIKVCINDHPDCCVVKEFQAPNCDGDCHIFDLNVQVGDCNPDSTYHVTINFGFSNPGNDLFDVFANGQLIGTYQLSQLPLHIPNFPGSGNAVDVIKVCINDHPDCCVVKEFQAPNCDGDCHIFDLNVQVGDCNPDGGYHVTINFGFSNPGNDLFDVFANGQLIGTYQLSQLPLHIPNFPTGVNAIAVIKVCINDHPDCCISKEFQQPNCDGCEINDLQVVTGNCTSDSTYVVSINFQVTNPPGNMFGLWGNGEFIGLFGLAQLPLTLQDFHWNGGAFDGIKVCFNTSPSNTAPACCAIVEYEVPDCLMNSGDCEILDMNVITQNCTSDSTYQVKLNFQVNNPPSDHFGVWANNQFLGNFTLSQLPLTFPNFPWNGGNFDFIKVCFVDNAGSLGCCKTIEFAVPDCLLQSGDCEIFGMVVDAGDCSSDSTYSLFLNFQVQNPPGNTFGVWANSGQFLGMFNLSQLPLNFSNFPWDGGTHDAVKVCFMNSGAITCCRSLEFAVPDCVGGNGNCHIWDVRAIRTECLCGQFFVVVTFNHENGGSGGFDLVGNGNNYGNYPYNYQQPIILGPFPGDATTVYEFGVVDHLHPDCEDGFVLGVVECMTQVFDPGNSSALSISPNPASSWVTVSAALESGVELGQSVVEIYHADGRLVQSLTVANGGSFQLEVNNLPSGVYRIAVKAGAGRLDGTFTKQ